MMSGGSSDGTGGTSVARSQTRHLEKVPLVHSEYEMGNRHATKIRKFRIIFLVHRRTSEGELASAHNLQATLLVDPTQRDCNRQ